MTQIEVKDFQFRDDGVIPNHPFLPTLLYKGALQGKEDQAEQIFNRNNWLNSWTNGVFDYHHYHSNSHEVLGVIRGSALLQIGGAAGREIEVRNGDVILLPAGTGHKKMSSSSDFSVVGAYPNGMDYNLRTGKQGERPLVLEEIANVPFPQKDPLFGEEGPLMVYWKMNN
ncbi:uncharacterized protein YjlB [Paenibacillus castaneae]|uniref:cupin domain-containing protein n=1 Tax=Paenibacillus castaneae TaxID=474957 RepID=UPI000C9B6FAD|nr:cupin domain-containing protein [Paenibacillus castaneae]NIK75460.1 uncharacterized protein YjlB [Paenibacillus castaneae]